MQPHPFSRLPRPNVVASVEYEGEVLSFHRPPCSGDIAFRVLYPDPVEARQVCSHVAMVNRRPRPYPLDVYGYALAIEATLAPIEGVEALDLTSLLTIYDHHPTLWQKLSEAALETLGLVDVNSSQYGAAAWEQVYGVLVEAVDSLDPSLVRQALSQATSALVALRKTSPAEMGGRLDPVMETIVGNASQPDPLE